MPKKLTTKEFIENAVKVHGDKYDYSKVVYVNLKTPICIICPIHGGFLQKPYDHLDGCGCQKCGILKRKQKLYGIGINDLQEPISSNGEHYTFYRVWKSMYLRCYGNHEIHNPTYSKCSVCEEWHLLSNFKKWFDENYVEGYHLDKDILVKGNKVYSPETCCFVPQEINNLFTNVNNNNPYPSINKVGGKFVVSIGQKKKHVGRFDTLEEATIAYRKAHREHIREIANKWGNKISHKVYYSLINYE